MMEIDVTKGKMEPRNRGDLNPPEFNSIDEERRHGLERLASAFRMFAHFGFDEGLAGHITLRDPEHKDHFWVNPFGVHFGQMKVSEDAPQLRSLLSRKRTEVLTASVSAAELRGCTGSGHHGRRAKAAL